MMEPTLSTPSQFAGLIGVARADITPPVGIYARSWGAATHAVAEGIHRPLSVTALTLQTAASDLPLVLIAADFGWWRTRADEAFVREGILEALSLPASHVMVACSHTHAGPSICREDGEKPGGEFIAPYLDKVREALRTASRQALANAQPATLTWATGTCDLAANRDLPDPNAPRYLSGWNPALPADSTLLVGRVNDQQGQTIATLVNYACHPTTLAWENRLLSPDYIGAMRETVEAQTHAPTLFLLGACGELAPREQYTGETALADSHGRRLGYAVLSTLEGMLPPATRLRFAGVMESGSPLALWQREPFTPSTTLRALYQEVEFPLQEMPTLAEFDAKIAACSDSAFRERLARKRRIRAQVGEGATTRMPFWCWRVGDAFLVGHPNEAYSHLQTVLRQQFPTASIAVMNVVNGHFGYLPSAELYDFEIYPVWQSPFGRGSLEQLIAACTEALQTLA